MSEILKGRAWVFGDDVDTDLIYHNKYLAETDPKNMPQYAFEYYPGKENFAKGVKPGDFVVAGKNFGCGSSREHAAIALKEMGASTVIAKSFARIFYRNAINLRLPLIVCAQAADEIQNGQRLDIDLSSGLITNRVTSKTLKAEPFSEKALEILSAGGIIQLMKKKYYKA